MRLWHYKLIPVLPRQQLLGGWRECIAIIGSIKKHGTPNHLLVNYVMNYDLAMFYDYSREVAQEMIDRGYKVNLSKLDPLSSLESGSEVRLLHYLEHDSDYFKVCYYNLYEKYLRGGIAPLEWDKIASVNEDV